MPNWESKEVDEALKLSREERQRKVTSIATQQGMQAALEAGLFWTPIWLGFKYLTPPTSFFNSKLSTSAKTATLISVPLFAFGAVSEQVASRLANPDAYHHEVIKKQRTTLNLYKRFANYTLEKPFSLIIMSSIPVIGMIAWHNKNQSALSVSQMIMHTRVIGQFSILVILTSTMGFYDYMRTRGPYLEPWEQQAALANNANSSKH